MIFPLRGWLVVRRTAISRIIAAGILFGVAGCEHLFDGATKGTEESEEEPVSRVTAKLAPAESREFMETISGLGQCEAMPARLAMLTPAVEGQVQAILAKPGDAVRAGQPLVEFDQAIARADYAEKASLRDSLVHALALLKSLPLPEEQQVNKLAIEQAKIALEKAQAVVDGLRPLRERNEVSKQQFLDTEQSLAQAKVQLQTAEAQYKLSMTGPRPEAVDEAKAKIDVANKGVERSEAQLKLLTIRAPIDGVLNNLDCHPGQTIAAGTVIGEVVDSRLLFATAWFTPRLAHRVSVGQKARVRPPAVRSKSEGSSTETQAALAGPVVFVGDVADPQTGNLPIRVEIDNSKGALAIGETVEVVVAFGEPTIRLAVPVAAINDIGEGPELSVVRDGKTVVLHPAVGTAQEGWIPVSGTDLKEGESVIVEGAYNLPEGTEVETAGSDQKADE